jgi:hypothetical protein
MAVQSLGVAKTLLKYVNTWQPVMTGWLPAAGACLIKWIDSDCSKCHGKLAGFHSVVQKACWEALAYVCMLCGMCHCGRGSLQNKECGGSSNASRCGLWCSTTWVCHSQFANLCKVCCTFWLRLLYCLVHTVRSGLGKRYQFDNQAMAPRLSSEQFSSQGQNGFQGLLVVCVADNATWLPLCRPYLVTDYNAPMNFKCVW